MLYKWKLINERILVLADARILRGRAQVPDGTGRQIWLDELRCRGTESRLVDCPRNAFGVITSCSHLEDVGLTCQQFVPGEQRVLSASGLDMPNG